MDKWEYMFIDVAVCDNVELDNKAGHLGLLGWEAYSTLLFNDCKIRVFFKRKAHKNMKTKHKKFKPSGKILLKI